MRCLISGTAARASGTLTGGRSIPVPPRPHSVHACALAASGQGRRPCPVGRQTLANVTPTDIQRLQDQVYDASNEVSRLRSRDQARADELQTQIDDVRDEVIYLRVKLRLEGSVSRSVYNDVRNHVDAVRSEARADGARPDYAPWPSGGGTGYGSGAGTSGRGGATTMVDLYQGNDLVIPAGSTLRGVISSVNKATRTDRKGSLTVAFDQISIRGRSYPIHGIVTQALESEGIKGEAAKIGAGAGVGAIIGGILGGAKGALLGILIGGGGTIAATEGKDVVLPAGAVLRVRFDEPLVIR